ncbi:MAG: FAD-dependent oxidoreductase [Candidatus Kapaibacterium sp.]
MQQTLQLKFTPEQAQIGIGLPDQSMLRSEAALALELPLSTITHVELVKRSIDARSRQINILATVLVYSNEPAPTPQVFSVEYPNVSNAKRVIVIGSGPAGLFAALKLIELGRKPIILERGKDVRSRRRDLAAIHKEQFVDPNSNYCFGEGGAGTYSDGKLYTRSDKRGNVRRVLERLVAHGASNTILVDAHPHIGTNNLPKIIQSMREAILQAGGEVHFDTQVIDLLIQNGSIRGVVDAAGNKFEGEAVILATGHSARDIFELLDRKKIALEAKPFALGVRIEHPQSLIDKIQYHADDRGEFLPPASYSLVEQVKGRGVYSFCMCPGGIIAPCATKQNEIVTNGWSPSKRNNPFANSGIVVSIELEDMVRFADHGALKAVRYQESVERAAWIAGGGTESTLSQRAPGQRMVDFVDQRHSQSLPINSYQPGVASVMLRDVLPKQVTARLTEAMKAFGKKLKGYYTNEAILVAVESRTSSPVRIPRNHETLEHEQIAGLYPCGEGAGYAGGIVSAAMDGERCAVQCAAKY